MQLKLVNPALAVVAAAVATKAAAVAATKAAAAVETVAAAAVATADAGNTQYPVPSTQYPIPNSHSIARFSQWKPGVFRFHSTELFLFRAIFVTSLRKFPFQSLFREIMGFDQILQRLGMVPQFGVYQADQQMRIHAFPFRKIHDATLTDQPAFARALMRK
jgi:hypothetical protein